MSVCFFPGLVPLPILDDASALHFCSLKGMQRCSFLFIPNYVPLCKVVQFPWACLPFCNSLVHPFRSLASLVIGQFVISLLTSSVPCVFRLQIPYRSHSGCPLLLLSGSSCPFLSSLFFRAASIVFVLSFHVYVCVVCTHRDPRTMLEVTLDRSPL